MQLLDGICRHVELQHIHRHRRLRHHAHGQQQIRPLRLEAGFGRGRRLLLLGHELRRLVQVAADVETHRAHQQPEDERQAPAPAFQLCGRQRRREQRAKARRQDRGQALARELPARVVTTAARAVLDHERRRAAEFTAHRKALHQPRQQDGDGCDDADLLVARHQRNRQRADNHQQDRQRERGLAPFLVGIQAKHDRADRPRDERHAKAAHCKQQRDPFVIGRKEQLADDGREEAVDEKVVPLKRIADRR